MKVLLIDGIVRAKCCGVIIVNHCLVLVVCIVIAELLNKCQDFTLNLNIKGFDDVEPTAFTVKSRKSIVCDDGKIRANECRGKFICTMLSAAEFG